VTLVDCGHAVQPISSAEFGVNWGGVVTAWRSFHAPTALLAFLEVKRARYIHNSRTFAKHLLSSYPVVSVTSRFGVHQSPSEMRLWSLHASDVIRWVRAGVNGIRYFHNADTRRPTAITTLPFSGPVSVPSRLASTTRVWPRFDGLTWITWPLSCRRNTVRRLRLSAAVK